MLLMFSFTCYGKINGSDLYFDSNRCKYGIEFIYSESEFNRRRRHFLLFFVQQKNLFFARTLSNVTNSIVNVDDFKIHENKDGSVDKTKTDLYMHLVDRKDNSILEVDEVLRIIDQNIEKLDHLFKVKKC